MEMLSSRILLFCVATCGFASANYETYNQHAMQRAAALGNRWGNMYNPPPPQYPQYPPGYPVAPPPPAYPPPPPVYGPPQGYPSYNPQCSVCASPKVVLKVVTEVSNVAQKVCNCAMGSTLRAEEIKRPASHIAPHLDKIQKVAAMLKELRELIANQKVNEKTNQKPNQITNQTTETSTAKPKA